LNHSNKELEKVICGSPTCLAMRSTHLCILGSLGAGNPSEICCGCISGILSKEKVVKMELYLKFMDLPLFTLESYSFITINTTSHQLNTFGSRHSKAYCT